MDVGKESDDNLNRLLKHLRVDSLAAQLVQIRRDTEAAKVSDAMKEILRDRLSTVKGEMSGGKT